jgi:hypothetical protein
MNFSHRLKPYTHPIDEVNSFWYGWLICDEIS